MPFVATAVAAAKMEPLPDARRQRHDREQHYEGRIDLSAIEHPPGRRAADEQHVTACRRVDPDSLRPAQDARDRGRRQQLFDRRRLGQLLGIGHSLLSLWREALRSFLPTKSDRTKLTTVTTSAPKNAAR